MYCCCHKPDPCIFTGWSFRLVESSFLVPKMEFSSFFSLRDRALMQSGRHEANKNKLCCCRLPTPRPLASPLGLEGWGRGGGEDLILGVCRESWVGLAFRVGMWGSCVLPVDTTAALYSRPRLGGLKTLQLGKTIPLTANHALKIHP